MFPAELVAELRKRPFPGLRIHLSDGTAYEVKHPELVMVGLGAAVIGTPDKSQPVPVYSTYDVVNLDQITRVEPLTPAATSN